MHREQNDLATVVVEIPFSMSLVLGSTVFLFIFSVFQLMRGIKVTLTHLLPDSFEILNP